MMRSEKILIIESDSTLIRLIKTHLEAEGYEIHIFRSASDAVERYFDSSYDVVIVGWAHTTPPGIEVCRQLRLCDQHTPIIMLSAERGEEHALEMLEAGADDCINIPFCSRDLSARIRTILRIYKRAKQIAFGRFEGKRLEINGLVIDSNVHRVTVRETAVKLTTKEYDLLYLLASNPGKVFSRRLLLDLLWTHDADVYEHTVNSHINRLRGKIEKNPGAPKYILTEWGVGYRFTDQWN